MNSDFNMIYNMDCLKGLTRIADGLVDLTVTSPPYDNLRTYNGNVEQWNFEKFQAIAKELYRVTADGGVVVWVVSDATSKGTESGTSFRQALYFKEIGFNLHDTMIYQKANYIPLTHNRYEQSFEYMFVFSKGKPKTFNPIMVPCKGAGKMESYGSGRRSQLDKNQAMRAPEGITYKATKEEKIHPNIFTYTCGGSKTGHPAVFPQQLAEDHVLSWSNKDDLVLDPFMGSGTTAIACINNGRNFLGFELDPQYYSLAINRIEKHQQQADYTEQIMMEGILEDII